MRARRHDVPEERHAAQAVAAVASARARGFTANGARPAARQEQQRNVDNLAGNSFTSCRVAVCARGDRANQQEHYRTRYAARPKESVLRWREDAGQAEAGRSSQ